MPSRSGLYLYAFAALWIVTLVGAFYGLQAYASIQGGAGAISREGFRFIQLHHRPGTPLLIMAVHPKCPCTRASLAELADLLARARGNCDAVLVELTPTHPSRSLWRTPANLRLLGGRDVPIVSDPEGKIAASLGAVTSGHAIFVNAQGDVNFSGGLTLSRGHRGPTESQDAILSWIRGDNHAPVKNPVFGCSLEMCEAEHSP